MLSEMQFENNPDGGDVQILFDKTALRKKPFDKRKLLWLFGAIGIIGLVIGNIWAGWGSWGKDSKHPWSPSPTPAINANSFNSSLNVRINDFNFDFHWHIDYDAEAIQFSVELKNGTFAEKRWMFIGFSNTRNIIKSDYCVFKNKKMIDGYINSQNNSLIPDAQQDCVLIQSDANGFSFKRNFSTCDPRDIVFSKGTTTHLFFASDESEAPNIEQITNRNAKLFSKIIPQTQLESDVSSLPITASNLTVTKDVVFWCLVKKLSESLIEKKHHLVRIEPLVTTGNEKVIQKMELFYCNYTAADSIEYNGTCLPEKTKDCTKSVFVWSLGASPFDFPKEAGFPLGGPEGAKYLMLKIQYAYKNPVNDSSGFNLYYTPTLRSTDAGILELGITPSTANSIPPKQQAFALSGYCLPECSMKFPENGITVFGSRLHTHSAGKLIRTSIYRGGKRGGSLNFDRHFAFDWPITDSLEPQISVEKGDMLMTTCVYNTEKIENMTFGGDNPESEMCSNIVYYYPAMEVSVCRSAIDDTALQNWFNTKQQTDVSKTVADKFSALKWDEPLTESLIELYATSPLKAECNNQAGILFNDNGINKWQNLKKPFISKISEESRIKYECPSIDDF